MVHVNLQVFLHLNNSVDLVLSSRLRRLRHVLQKARILTYESVAQSKEVDRGKVLIGIKATGNTAEQIFNLLHDLQGFCLLDDIPDGD